MTLLEQLTQKLEQVPLSISSTRRAGSNGLRNADEVAAALMPIIEEATLSPATTTEAVKREPGICRHGLWSDPYVKQLQLEVLNARATLPPVQESVVDEAYGYAYRLFKYLAPRCEPLDTTLGVLTQLENYIVGLRPMGHRRR